VAIKNAKVVQARKNDADVFVVKTEDGKTYHGKLTIATGL
jgi:thioredoxin reductase